MKAALAFFIALVACQAAMAEDIVVIGKLVSNEPMDYVKYVCPDGDICMRSWWRSVVEVRKTIRGSHLSGRVAAAIMQHTSLNPDVKKKVRLFVLKPIEDPEQHSKLRVDYYLEDMSDSFEVFCLSHDPKEFGLNVEITYVGGAEEYKSYCFELPPS